MKIKERLKEILPREKYELWIEPIIEHTAEGIGNLLIVPNIYKSVLRLYAYPGIGNLLIVPNIYFKDKISEILKSYNISAGILIQEELLLIQKQQELKIAAQKPVETKPLLSAKTLQMEKPYSKEKVATSEIVNSKFFKYPNDIRKYSATQITLNDQEYIVHRGKNTPDPNEEPIGQLDTNHLRILLAIIHIWQEQNCKFFGVQALVNLSVTLREIAKKIGYKINGEIIKWLQKKLEELSKCPITLERKSDGKANSFTFISKLTTQTEGRNSRKNKIILTLNSILSQQLYERKAILRN